MCSAALSRESGWWARSPLSGSLGWSQVLASLVQKRQEWVLLFPVWAPLSRARGLRFQGPAQLFPTGIDSRWVETRSVPAPARRSAPLNRPRVLPSVRSFGLSRM